MTGQYSVGDWVLVRFPYEETGKARKLSQPWHGPYHVVDIRKPDMTVVKVYRPQDGQIQITRNLLTPCPDSFQAGYYWYGDKRTGPGKPPKWIDNPMPEDQESEETPLDVSAVAKVDPV